MTEFSHCPDCSTPLGKDRSKCRCGWAMPQVQQQKTNPNHIPCASDPNCRFSGRLWVEGLDPKHRVCVDHYYQWTKDNRGKLPIEKLSPGIPR